MGNKMQIVLTVLIVCSLLLSALCLLKLRHVSRQAENLTAIVHAGGAKTLVANIDRVTTGVGKDEVTRLLGPADNPGNQEWLYYLDGDSGYAVKFDAQEQVESVQSWKS